MRNKKTTLLFLMGVFSYFLFSSEVFSAKLFSDVPPENQFFEAVSALEQRGIINGFSDGSFHPNERITRAAALKIILLSAGVELTGVATKDPFPDVPKSEWFAPIAKKGQELGIVKGDGNGNFLPSRNVSRSEALAMLFRTNGDTLSEPTEQPFSDIFITAWFAKYFSAAKQTGLLQGSVADPEHFLTRGELSDLTYRFFRGDWNSTEMKGEASYYGDSFDGRGTASGEKFSNAEYTAAHRTLPFGTHVRATHPESLKSVVVKVNDRGPHISGRVVDLSKSAFEVLSPAGSGVTPVILTKVSESTPLGPAKDCGEKKNIQAIPKDFYEGMSLFRPIPRQFRTNEVYMIFGEITASQIPEMVIAFYGEEPNQKVFRGEISGKTFSIPIFFPEAGEFLFSLFPGKSGKAKAEKIVIKTPKCEQNIDEMAEAPSNLRQEIKNGETVFSWDDFQNNFYRLEFTQEGKSVEFFVSQSQKLMPPPSAFQNFSEGPATVFLWGSKTDANSNRITEWRRGGEMKLFVSRRVSRESNTLKNITLTEQFSLGNDIIFSGKTDDPLDKKAVIIDPNENIFEIDIKISGENFSGRFTPKLPGSYTLEINRNDALTLFVGSVISNGITPLLPDFFDLSTGMEDENTRKESMPETMLRFLNRERKARKLPELSLHTDLQALAQFRADDMCRREYFSHVDPDFKKAEDYRVLYNVQTAVAENIAKDTKIKTAHESLMRSPAHRKLIISPNYVRVGFGFCHSKNEPDAITVVEIFGGEPFSTDALPELREKILQDINSVRPDNPIVPNETIQSVAQQWASRMAKQNFLGFQDGNNSLESSLRDTGIREYAQGIVLKLGSISDINGAFSKAVLTLGETDQENFLLKTDFQKMGIGIAQNEIWEIFVVLLAT